jgi:galactose mutarotase-like enzyme
VETYQDGTGVALGLRGGRLCITHLTSGGEHLLHHEGAPLVGPWFGRLGDPTFEFASRRADVRLGPWQPDEEGRPLHGLVSAPGDWELEAHPGLLTATGSWYHRGAFPFPHRVQVAVSARPGGIEVTTGLEAGAVAVPCAFGWHPYLAAASHRGVHVALGEELALAGSLPDGTTTGRHGPLVEPGPLDSYWTVSDGDEVLVAGDPAVSVRLVSGWRHAVLWAPEGASFTCVEPLAGPLAPFDGTCPVVPPHGALHTVFTITCAF